MSKTTTTPATATLLDWKKASDGTLIGCPLSMKREAARAAGLLFFVKREKKKYVLEAGGKDVFKADDPEDCKDEAQKRVDEEKPPVLEPLDDLHWLEPVHVPKFAAGASAYRWVTSEGDYRVSRIESSDGESYFGAERGRNGKYPHSVEHAPEGPGYPKHYPSLKLALEACEAYWAKQNGKVSVTSNREEIIAKAAASDLDHSTLAPPKAKTYTKAAKPKADRPEGQAQAPRGGGGVRYNLFGHPITAVLRWMGANGWEKARAVKALKKLNIECSETTVGIQLRAGKTKDASRGEPAPITTVQAAQLTEAGN